MSTKPDVTFSRAQVELLQRVFPAQTVTPERQYGEIQYSAGATAVVEFCLKRVHESMRHEVH